MSYIFSRALVEEYLLAKCSGTDAFAQSNGTHTPQVYLPSDKTTAFSRLSRFGMTFGHLTADRGAELLTWWLAGFHVRTLALPEKAQESTANDLVCGHTWRALSVRFCPDSCSWKTAQCLWDEDLHESSVILPRWGMTANGECWERMTWVRPMSVNDCGSWPTPTVCGNYNRKGLSKTSGDGLATAVKKWPTPQAHKTTRSGEIVNVDGTPWDGIRKPHSKTTGRQITTALADAVAHGGDQTQPTTLNPNWVEWLMGWPIGWTDLKPLETDKFLSAPQQRGAF